jgi:hypothetical protein
MTTAATETDHLLGGDIGNGELNPNSDSSLNGRQLGYVSLASLFVFVVVLGFSSIKLLKERPEFWVATIRQVEESSELKKGKGYNYCADDGLYSKRTLKLAYELPFIALFKDNRGQKTYEASDVIKVDDIFYAVHDNSWAISRFSAGLVHFSVDNVQVGEPKREKETSGYEAIVHSDGLFYVIRESIEFKSNEIKAKSGKKNKATPTFHAVVEELQINATDNYDILNSCPCEFTFEGTSKGFEGAIGIKDQGNTFTLIGLCEGNYCSEGDKGKDSGNGRLVVMQKNLDANGTCVWSTIKIVNIPKTADFQDYSSIDINAEGRVAITSQEGSKVWIGQMTGLQENGLYDLTALDLVDAKKGYPTIYDFPRNSNCDVVYCNIEGISWLNNQTLISVSDRMKSGGKQNFQCFDKDQSVHVFSLP